MAGGTFIPGQNKVRPGMYTRFVSGGLNEPKLNNLGVMILPLQLKWGNAGDVIKVTNEGGLEALYQLGYDITHPTVLLVKEALKEAATVLVYNLTGGTKAKAVVGSLTFTATKAGERGNKLSLTIKTNPLGGKDILLYLEGSKIFEATGVTEISTVKSQWFTVSGSGSIDETAKTEFSTGTSTQMNNSDVINFLDNCELYNFKTMAFPFIESELHTALLSKLKYFRDEVGKNIVAVTSDFATCDYPYIINVKNGVVLDGGTKLTASQATAWVAGARAAAGYTEDLTYKAYPGAVDANPRLKHSQIVDGLKTGQFIFSTQTDSNSERVKVVVEEDINTHHTFTEEWDESFTDNKVVAVLDAVIDLGSQILVPNVFPNHKDGIKLAQDRLISLLTTLQAQGALKNVDPDSDVVVDEEASKGKTMYATILTQPVRTFKKYFVTVKNN